MTLVPRTSRFLALAAAALLTSACAAQGPGAQSTSLAPSPSVTASQTAAATADASGLVKATHPQCDQGPKILQYLTTGDNGGDPQLDVAFSQHVGAPAPEARSIVDQYIQQCDARIDSQASASAKAQADASAAQAQASASAAAAEKASEEAATLDITRAASCDAIGGTVKGDVCHSTVQGSPGGPGLNCSYAVIELKGDGTIDPAALADVKKQLPGCFR